MVNGIEDKVIFAKDVSMFFRIRRGKNSRKHYGKDMFLVDKLTTIWLNSAIKVLNG